MKISQWSTSSGFCGVFLWSLLFRNLHDLKFWRKSEREIGGYPMNWTVRFSSSLYLAGHYVIIIANQWSLLGETRTDRMHRKYLMNWELDKISRICYCLLRLESGRFPAVASLNLASVASQGAITSCSGNDNKLKTDYLWDQHWNSSDTGNPCGWRRNCDPT